MGGPVHVCDPTKHGDEVAVARGLRGVQREKIANEIGPAPVDKARDLRPSG